MAIMVLTLLVIDDTVMKAGTEVVCGKAFHIMRVKVTTSKVTGKS